MALPLPTKTRSWQIFPNRRISYTSLAQVRRQSMWEWKEWLKSLGATVAGSSNGTTANMSGTDLLTTDADFATLAANTTTAHAWVVVNLGNNIRLLLDAVGAADNQCRIAFSTGAYSLAGTPTFSPTTTDEIVVLGTTTAGADMFSATASGDRIWNGWCSAPSGVPDLKNIRFSILRAAATVSLWGVEEVNPTGVVDPAAVTFSPPVWGFFYGGTTGGGGPSALANLVGPFNANNRGGRAKATVGGITAVMDLHGGGEGAANASSYGFGQFSATPSKLQGDAYPLIPVSLYCTVPTTHLGKLANRVDWWGGKSGEATGNHIGNVEFVSYGDGFIWPWDGTPTVAGTSITVT